MNGKLTGNTIISSKKFDTITIVENGLILTNKQKEKTTILFSVINKTYIKKHKISFLNKICFLTIFLILMFGFSFYLPNELTMASLILIIPLIVKINTYKWYQFNLVLDDETFIKKVFYTYKKQEYINLVNTIKKEVYHNRIKSQIPLKKPLELCGIVENYSFRALNIA